jgi:hypothetical protein
LKRQDSSKPVSFGRGGIHSAVLDIETIRPAQLDAGGRCCRFRPKLLTGRSEGGKHDEVAQEFSPDDLKQTPNFDPAEPKPFPEDDFDQTWKP